MISKIKGNQKEGNTIGGTITCVIKNLPVGIGEPVFPKITGRIGKSDDEYQCCKRF